MNLTTFGAMLCSAPSFSLDTFCARACSLGNVHLRAWSAFYSYDQLPSFLFGNQVNSGAAGDKLSSMLRFVDVVADPFQVLP